MSIMYVARQPDHDYTHSGVKATLHRHVTFPGLYLSLVSTFFWHLGQVIVTGNGSNSDSYIIAQYYNIIIK